MFFAVIVIVAGLIFLSKNLGLITGDIWPIIWPCLIIAFGFSLLVKRRNQKNGCEKFGEIMKRFGKEMHETFGDKERKD